MVGSPSVKGKKGSSSLHNTLKYSSDRATLGKNDWRPPTPHSLEKGALKQQNNSSNINSLEKRWRPPMPPPRYVDELDLKKSKPDGANELNYFTSWISRSLYPRGESVATEKEDRDPPLSHSSKYGVPPGEDDRFLNHSRSLSELEIPQNKSFDISIIKEPNSMRKRHKSFDDKDSNVRIWINGLELDDDVFTLVSKLSKTKEKSLKSKSDVALAGTDFGSIDDSTFSDISVDKYKGFRSCITSTFMIIILLYAAHYSGLNFGFVTDFISDRKSEIMQSLKNSLGDEITEDINLPQGEALTWIMNEDRAIISDVELIERYVIALVYFSLDGPYWLNKDRWLSKDPICDWNGITCSLASDGIYHISKIELVSNDLQGKIPNEISKLSYLQELMLNGNYIEGSLPKSLSEISQLQKIDLFDNYITGKIPDTLFTGTPLTTFRIQLNSISGTIPSNIGLAKSLKHLVLSGNQLSGSIPPSIGELDHLGK